MDELKVIIQKHFMAQKLLDKKLKGYAALTSVIVLSAVATLVLITSIQINTESVIASKTLEDSKKADALAYSCVEVAIENLKQDQSYSGNEVVLIGTDSCEILPIITSGSDTIIRTQAIYDDNYKRYEASLAQIVPDVTINYFDVVDDF